MKNETVSHLGIPIRDPAAENGDDLVGLSPIIESRGTLSESIAWAVALVCAVLAAALAWTLWLEAGRPIQIVIPVEDVSHVLVIPITPTPGVFDGTDPEVERWQELTR